MNEGKSWLNEQIDAYKHHENAKESRVVVRGQGSRNSVTQEQLTVYRSAQSSEGGF